MKKWFKALSRTRDNYSGGIKTLFSSKKITAEELEDLEEALIAADVPVRMVDEWISETSSRQSAEEYYQSIHDSMIAALGDAGPSGAIEPVGKPHVLLLVGVNGAGKTTTAAKLAYQFQSQGMTPLLAAGDTFRAAGTDQLRMWAERVDCEVVSGMQGADPASVAFDAVEAGQARETDVVIIDTAGRMHTKQHLMQELGKVNRAIDKAMPGAPHDTWVVLDAALGNNALQQARAFHESTPLTGIVVTKLDGSSKAGFLLAVRQELNLPIKYIGLGEQMEDLVRFNPEEYTRAVLGREDDAA